MDRTLYTDLRWYVKATMPDGGIQYRVLTTPTYNRMHNTKWFQKAEKVEVCSEYFNPWAPENALKVSKCHWYFKKGV